MALGLHKPWDFANDGIFGVAVSGNNAQGLLQATLSQMNLSARAFHRTRSVKLAPMIADLAGSEEIRSTHLAEALQYRPKLMM